MKPPLKVDQPEFQIADNTIVEYGRKTFSVVLAICYMRNFPYTPWLILECVEDRKINKITHIAVARNNIVSRNNKFAIKEGSQVFDIATAGLVDLRSAFEMANKTITNFFDSDIKN